MNQYIFFFLFITILSCNVAEQEGTDILTDNSSIETDNVLEEEIPEVELFEREDILAINQQLAKLDTILNPKEIMKLYYPSEIETTEGKETISITEKSLEHEKKEVTLIHDYLMDDSMKGIKYIMLLKQQKDKWKIISIKKNWKCYKGRGHSYWSISPCQ